MKKLIIYSLMLPLLFSAGCIKNEHKVYKGAEVVEFDATVLNSPAVGVSFPLMTRVPAYGVAASTSHPSITRTSGTIKFRVNLVGRQSASEQIIKYKVVTSDFSSTLDVTTGSSQRLAAASGTHFTTTGTLKIPANSSFGELEITVVNPGSGSSIARYLVVELEGNESIRPSKNFMRLGIQISQS